MLAGRTNKALVGREEFSAAVLRSVAGIEKKRSILQGMEKEVVARHEVGLRWLGSSVIVGRVGSLWWAVFVIACQHFVIFCEWKCHMLAWPVAWVAKLSGWHFTTHR